MRNFKSVVNALIQNLKFKNELFPDQIHFHDHKGKRVPESNDIFRITDAIANYAIIYPVHMDERIERKQTGTLFLYKRFTLLSDCVNCDRDLLLEFCFQAVSITPGCRPVTMSSDSERIYLEETGAETKTDTNLIRITFDVAIPSTVSKTKVCLELCSTPEC